MWVFTAVSFLKVPTKYFTDRSDDLLLPSRFLSLLSLPNSRSPPIVQLISMNDYGESHNIFPVMGAQPGSDSWTTGMDHEGLRWISRYFLQRWRDGKGEVEGIDEVKFVLWYRTKPAVMEAEDSVGRPRNADWVGLVAGSHKTPS